MQVRKKLFLFTVFALFLQVQLTGCLPGASSLSAGRPDVEVETGESTEGEDENEFFSCLDNQLYDVAVNECVEVCPSTTEAVSRGDSDFDERLNDFLVNDIENIPSVTDEIQSEIRSKIEINRDFCFAIKRPSNKISIKEGFCACRDGKPDILGDCVSFCNGKTTTTEAKLYAEAVLDPDVQSNSKFGNLHNWCNSDIGDGLAAPSCVLRAESLTTSLELTVQTFPNSNRFETNISTLPFDQTFIFRLVEKGSGSNAQTRAKQLMRIQQEDNNNNFIETPLQITSVNQYDCYSLVPDPNLTTSQNLFANQITKQHYYFPSNEQPLPLPPDLDTVYCHDIQQFPGSDSAIYPRLNVIPGHLAMWDKRDIRFVDSDSNGQRDINDLLTQKITEEYNISYSFDNIFTALPLPLMPEIDNQTAQVTGNWVESNTGFFMTPFTNFSTGEIFCPTRDHYNSNDPVFRVMKEVVGVDTEAVYFALSEKTTINLSDGQKRLFSTFVAIRESTLKKIWFYFDNGQHLEHNSVTAFQRPIHFYWPPNPSAPFQKNADQKLYTVGTSEEVSSQFTTFDDGSITSKIEPRDKRFGCIPVID
jgi:hypothetical protein